MKDINSKLILPHIVTLISLLGLLSLEKTGNILVQFILISLVLGDLFALMKDCRRGIEKEIVEALKEYEKNR
jgi:ABC-type glycerol-3-phosphate transport system permease component